MADLHLPYLVESFLCLLLIPSLAQDATMITSTSDDIGCLKALKASISDPNGYLSSWDLTNTTQGSICKLNGVDCWNPNENIVLNIRLSNMGLKGHFPSGLQMCASMTGLDLSSNSFTGSIPENISDMVPFLISMDLSYNSFSGEIPMNLSGCQYLNTMNLQHNSFAGNIPSQLTTLTRLTTFNVANNLLTGPIPAFTTQFPNDSYANNAGLCGAPLGACRTASERRTPGVGVIVATALGAVIGFWIGVGLSYVVLGYADSVTPWFYYYIMLRKYTLYLLSSCARDT